MRREGAKKEVGCKGPLLKKRFLETAIGMLESVAQWYHIRHTHLVGLQFEAMTRYEHRN